MVRAAAWGDTGRRDLILPRLPIRVKYLRDYSLVRNEFERRWRPADAIHGTPVSRRGRSGADRDRRRRETRNAPPGRVVIKPCPTTAAGVSSRSSGASLRPRRRAGSLVRFWGLSVFGARVESLLDTTAVPRKRWLWTRRGHCNRPRSGSRLTGVKVGSEMDPASHKTLEIFAHARLAQLARVPH